LLKHHASARVSEIEQKLRSLTRKQIADKKTVLDDEPLIIAGQDKKLSMNSYLFSNFRLSYQNWKLGDPNTPNTDLMRAIKVSDSAPLLIDVDKDVNLPVVAEVISSSFREDGSQRIAERRASNYIEMVWNVKAEFTISIDTEMLSWFQHEQGMQIPPQLQTVEGILEICKEFAQAQWEHERQYWSKIKDSAQLDFGSIRSFYGKPCKYSLRLGWGSGMLGTTVSCSLPFEKSIRVNIRNACSTKQTSSSETPKSRRTAVIPNQGHPIKKPLGWVDFTPL
jgi:CRISPR-associated protein Csm5